jgi:integrase
MIPRTRSHYQTGTIVRNARSKGPDVWVFRYRDYSQGQPLNRKRIVGDVEQYPTWSDAKAAVDSLRIEVNARQDDKRSLTVEGAWQHFQENELHDPDVNRSPTTIQGYLDYFKTQILPRWGKERLEDIKAVVVEKWLRSLQLAPASKAKIRNHMSALFSHCIRWELYDRLNPIRSVRQSAVRLREPDVLTLDEMRNMLGHMTSVVAKLMVLTAAASALRRSELRGLKWADLDFEKLWFHLHRGIVGKMETRMKTQASRKGVPMHPDLAIALERWRAATPYPQETDWVFASPYTKGKRPYWPDSILKDHVRPAIEAAGIVKRVGWHTFRHSLATLLGHEHQEVKVVQELLRHSSSRITQDVYQQGDQDAKRAALAHVSEIFLLPKAS